MADDFDPYHKWLGIRPGERPITHYRLLGLSQFEDDPDVITDAADRQMAHVRNYQTGKHSVLSQKVLNELSAAKLTLLNKQKKAAYDAALKAAENAPAVSMAPQQPGVAQAVGQGPESPVESVPDFTRPSAEGDFARGGAPVAALAAVAVGLLVLLVGGGVAAWMFLQGSDQVAVITPPDPSVVPPTDPNTVQPGDPDPMIVQPRPPKDPGETKPDSKLPPEIEAATPAEAPGTFLAAPPGLLRNIAHNMSVTKLAISPDGQRAVTMTGDSAVRLWDLVTGKRVRELTVGEKRQINSLTIAADGRRVAFAGLSRANSTALVGEVQVWDFGEKTQGRTVKTDRIPFGTASISRDGRQLLVGATDSTLRWIDVEKPAQSRSFSVPFSMSAARFLPGRRILLTQAIPHIDTPRAPGDRSNQVEVWDLEKGAMEFALSGHPHPVCALAVSANGKRAVTGGIDGALRLWDLEAKRELWNQQPFAQPIHTAAISGNGEWVYAATRDGVQVFSAAGNLSCRVNHIGCSALAVADDHRILLTSGADTSVRLWRMPDAPTGGQLLPSHTAALDAETVATTEPKKVDPPVEPVEPARPKYPPSEPFVLEPFETEAPRQFLGFQSGLLRRLPHEGAVGAVAMTPDGRWAITCGVEPLVRVWDLVKGREVHAMSGQGGMSWGAAISADARRGVTSCFDGMVRVWDLKAGKLEREMPGHTGRVVQLALSADGRRILSPGHDGTVRLWNADTGESLHVLKGHGNQVITAAFLPDGRGITGGGVPFVDKDPTQDATLKVWNLETGKVEFTLKGHEGCIDGLAVSADGRYALSGAWDRTVRLWDLTARQEIWRDNASFTQPVKTVAISSDAQWLLAGSSDGKIKVWDFSGQALSQAQHAGCETLAVAGDKRIMLTGGTDNSARLWRLPDAPSGEAVPGTVELMGDGAGTHPEPPLRTTPKLAPPDAVVITANKKAIREEFSREYKARSSEQHEQRARKLMLEARKLGENDPARRYVLLMECLEAANEAGEAAQAFEAVEALKETFEPVDTVALKSLALREAARLPRTTPKLIAQLYRAVVEEAVSRDEFDEANTLVTAGIAAARKANDTSLVTDFQNRGKEVRELRVDFGKIKAAREKLATSPDDVEACILVGKYLCVSSGKWDEGLALWDKSQEPALIKIAQLERNRPRKATAMIELGDLWWIESEKERGSLKGGLQARAAYWYRRAIPTASGTTLLRIEKRVSDAPKPVIGSDVITGPTQSGP